MPGPGTARDRPARGTFRDATTAGTPDAVRLRDGLDGWRRNIRRRQSAAAARLWSLIALGAGLAGVTAGRLDGSMLVTAAAAAALPLGAGLVSVVRRRQVCAEDAARQLDAAFGFDEQVATALCCIAAGTVGGGAAEHDRLVAELIERAAGLVAQTRSVPRSRPVPAYGEWAVMAVTAAAVAAVTAVPGPHPETLTTAGGGPGRASLAAGATTAPQPAHEGGRLIPWNAGHRTAPSARGASAEGAAAGAAAGETRRGASGIGTKPASATGIPTATGGAPSFPAKAGAQTSPAQALSPTSPGTSGASAAGGRSVTGPAGGFGQHGPASPGPGRAQTTQSPATQAPATQSQTTRPVRSATTQHAAGSRGTAARTRGLPGGDAAGTEPGNDRRSARPAQALPSAGNTVLVIVLPGGEGTATARTGQAAPGQPAGNGGAVTATQAATALGNTAEYVPPDQNEVPFPDQGMLWRYF